MIKKKNYNPKKDKMQLVERQVERLQKYIEY